MLFEPDKLVGAVNVIFDSAVHPAKALPFIVCMLVGSVSDVSPVHPANALVPIACRLVGSVSDAIVVALQNTEEEITVIPAGIVTEEGKNPVYPVTFVPPIVRLYSVFPNI